MPKTPAQPWLMEIIEAKGFRLEQVNAKEMGLFWKRIPHRTLLAKQGRCVLDQGSYGSSYRGVIIKRKTFDYILVFFF